MNKLNWILSASSFVVSLACGSSHSGPVAQNDTGMSCSNAQQCYPGVADAGLLYSAPVCMAQFTNGYCTHHCAVDADCCSVAGECPNSYPEVCGPFESTGEMYCFLSCEDADVRAAGWNDASAYCQTYANSTFICRSTGGGSSNRKVCVPNG